MSDEQPRPNPGAAARRARRIGGRPVPSPGARTDLENPADDTTTGVRTAPQPGRPTPAAGVDLEKRQSVPDEPGTPRRGTVSTAWAPAMGLGVAVVLLLALLAVFSFRGYWAKPSTRASTPTTQQQEQVLAAAKTCFSTLNTYDYTKLDDSLAAALKCTTGTFTSAYQQVFKAQIRQYAPTLHAVQTAQANRAGIVSISPNGKEWEVLVFGQLQTTNVSTAKGSPRIAPTGGVLKMDLVGGKWLVGKVDTDAGNGLPSS